MRNEFEVVNRDVLQMRVGELRHPRAFAGWRVACAGRSRVQWSMRPMTSSRSSFLIVRSAGQKRYCSATITCLPSMARLVDDRQRIVQRRRQRLFHQHMHAGLEAADRMLAMQPVGTDDQCRVGRRMRQGLFQVVVEATAIAGHALGGGEIVGVWLYQGDAGGVGISLDELDPVPATNASADLKNLQGHEGLARSAAGQGWPEPASPLICDRWLDSETSSSVGARSRTLAPAGNRPGSIPGSSRMSETRPGMWVPGRPVGRRSLRPCRCATRSAL